MATQTLHIAVGVLINAQGQVLIAQRRAGTDGEGKWEFPGGKRETGESIEAALARELDEELGVQVVRLRPMLRFHHDYTSLRVLLDIWLVLDWRGEPYGREGQSLAWCAQENLRDYDLLSANKPIVDAIRLPATYVITPEPGSDTTEFLRNASTAAARGQRLFRLRAWGLADDAYERLARELMHVFQHHGASLMLDRNAEMLTRLGAAGLHVPASVLASLKRRPVSQSRWFAASCHNRSELLQAKAIGADFAILSPVKTTPSHPNQASLGWAGFAQERDDVALPVYALGGLTPEDVQQAFEHGAQGTAGISAFWPKA